MAQTKKILRTLRLDENLFWRFKGKVVKKKSNISKEIRGMMEKYIDEK